MANNGGKTQTHKLKKGSPDINKGTASIVLPFDQRGTPFKRKLGLAVIMGAFERQLGITAVASTSTGFRNVDRQVDFCPGEGDGLV